MYPSDKSSILQIYVCDLSILFFLFLCGYDRGEICLLRFLFSEPRQIFLYGAALDLFLFITCNLTLFECDQRHDELIQLDQEEDRHGYDDADEEALAGLQEIHNLAEAPEPGAGPLADDIRRADVHAVFDAVVVALGGEGDGRVGLVHGNDAVGVQHPLPVDDRIEGDDVVLLQGVEVVDLLDDHQVALVKGGRHGIGLHGHGHQAEQLCDAVVPLGAENGNGHQKRQRQKDPCKNVREYFQEFFHYFIPRSYLYIELSGFDDPEIEPEFDGAADDVVDAVRVVPLQPDDDGVFVLGLWREALLPLAHDHVRREELAVAVALDAAAVGLGLSVDRLLAVFVDGDADGLVYALRDVFDGHLSLVGDRVVAGVDQIEGVGYVVFPVVAAVHLVQVLRQIEPADIRHVVDDAGVQGRDGVVKIRRFGKGKSLIDHIVFVDLDREAAELVVEIRRGVYRGDDHRQDHDQQPQHPPEDYVLFCFSGGPSQFDDIPLLIVHRSHLANQNLSSGFRDGQVSSSTFSSSSPVFK